MPDINISNLQVPPTTTMPAHVASANPHPQYALVDDIANIAKVSIAVSNLADVNVVEPQLANTILIYDGNNYNPIDMTTLGTLIQIPMATSNNAGIIRVASTIFELDSCAATPKLVVDYVNSTVAASAYGYATTVANGVVRLATANDIASSDQSAVVTASALNDVVSSNLYTLPAATNSTLGGVKTIETDSPTGREFIAGLITSNSKGSGGVSDFNTYVPAIQYNQFVNVRVGTYDSVASDITSEIYYSTHAETVSTDASAHTLANDNNKVVAYLVYSNGVISGVSNGYNDISSTYVDILEQGIAYDINTSGAVVTVHQEGNIKRVVVPNYQLNVYGTAHDVVISSGGNVVIDSHGHLEYAKVESGGILHCFDGVAENITIYSGGLVHIDGGKGYNITLLSGATAYIYTYAKDIVVHGGAHLGTPNYYDYTRVTSSERINTEPKIDNLVLYTGASFFPTSNTTINGCILHPGATVNYVEGATINYNTCRETEHPVWVIKSRVVNYYKDTETSKEFGVTSYTYENPSGDIIVSDTLPQLVAFFEPKGTSIVHNYTDRTSSSTATTIDRVYVWAIDTPCGFRRIDTSAVSAIDSMLSDGVTASNADEYTRQTHLASTYISAQIISHVKAGAQITNYYALEVPTSTIIYHTATSDYEAHMVYELTSETSRYKYNVVF